MNKRILIASALAAAVAAPSLVMAQNGPAPAPTFKAEKCYGLAKAGIEITGRMPIETPINSDNRRYLTAKATRAGHKLDHLLAAISESVEPSSEPVGGDRTP